MNRLVVIGCGWLGKRLFSYWQSHLPDWQFVALRRTAAGLHDLPAQVQPLVWQEPASDDALATLQGAIWLIAIAPGADMAAYHQTLQQWTERAASLQCRQLILCSSTGVYSGLGGEISEDSQPDLSKPRVAQLVTAECIVQQYPRHSVLRLAGLFGEGRHPGRFCARGQLAGADLPVNLVHSDQIAAYLACWLTEQRWPALVNIVHDDHPTKQQFYPLAAQRYGLAAPTFTDADEQPRIVRSSLLPSLQWPSLLEMMQNIKTL